ncbi:ABC transporter ATP-binding protein [Leeia oryzae]|uniref:ABC transporter ATP-binding protein n=1 Tax=Leeia oryzae TaxID=356662 RepID=UPI0003A6D661|nr:ABC transporter ATP-binding protein [Leeia oryzae]
MQQRQVAIHIDQVSMCFGQGAEQVTALDSVSLDILENEFFTLLGPSGCGKTTLLRLIAGFEQPTSGHLQLYGQRLEGTLPFQRPINTVFQSYALFPHLTVAKNIAFGLEMQKKPQNEIDATVEEMLALVKLKGFANRRPHQLSGGQQQRVALARALANRPKVLLLDESLSALDLKLRKEMQVELKRLQRETGITFIFVTHDQEEALTMSDRIAVMSGGVVQQVGAPADIYDRPVNRFVADFIGETNFLNAVVVTDGFDLGKLGTLPYPVSKLGLGSKVTLALRPERLCFSEDGLPGVVENVVYMGTDTIYHISLQDQPGMHVRLQNDYGAQAAYQIGNSVKVGVLADSIRVLED